MPPQHEEEKVVKHLSRVPLARGFQSFGHALRIGARDAAHRCASTIRSIFTPREPFTSSRSPGCDEFARNFAGLLRSSRRTFVRSCGCPASTRRVHETLRHHPARRRSSRFFRSCGSSAPAFAMQFRRRIAQLQHFSRGQNSPPIARRRRQQLDQRAQRHRIRVVAIVDHRKSVVEPQHLAAHVRGLQRRKHSLRFGRADAPHAGRGQRRERVGNVVPPGQRQSKPRAPRGPDKIERRPSMPRSSIFSARNSAARSSPNANHAPARDFREPRHALVVRVQHRRRIRPRQTLDQFALGQRNFVHRRKKFQMHRARRASPRPRPARNFRQALQFARVRHPQFHHRRFVFLVKLQQRQRQSVFVVQIALGLQYAEPRAQQRRQNFFCGGLSDRAGDRRR